MWPLQPIVDRCRGKGIGIVTAVHSNARIASIVRLSGKHRSPRAWLSAVMILSVTASESTNEAPDSFRNGMTARAASAAYGDTTTPGGTRSGRDAHPPGTSPTNAAAIIIASARTR